MSFSFPGSVSYSELPKFGKYAFLLNEDKNPNVKLLEEEIDENFLEKLIQSESREDVLQVTRLGNLLAVS